MIRLRLLGSLSLERDDGTAVRSVLAQPKRFALLAYLAASHPPAPRRRDTLLGLFWAESDESHARTSLRQALYQLRRSLGSDILTGEGDERVGVDPERIWCDAAAFEKARTAGRPEEALEHYGGPFLEGFHLSGTPEFERWIERERRRLRIGATRLAWELAEAKEQQGDRARARTWAERAMELSPYDEELFRRYLELLARHGDRATAVRTFDVFARRLAQDLGIRPSEQTAALLERIRGASPRTVRAATPPDGVVEESPVDKPIKEFELSEPGEPAPVPAPDLEDDAGIPGLRIPTFGRIAAVVGLLVAGAAVLVTYEEVISRQPGSLIGNGGVDDPATIVLADFVDHTPDSLLGLTVTEVLRVDLAGSPVVRLATPERVRSALSRMGGQPAAELTTELAREIAVREGLEAVVGGAVHPVGAGYVLTAEIIDPRSGQILDGLRATVQSRTELIPTIDRFGRTLRRRIGESRLSLERRPSLPRVTTASLPALQMYAAGFRALRRDMDYRRGTEFVRRALVHDSTFAMAWRQLAVAHQNFGGGQDSIRSALEKALAHRNRLTPLERYLAVGTYEMLITGRRDRAAQAFRQALDLAPASTTALGNLGALHLWFFHDYQEAEVYFRRLARVGPAAGIRLHLWLARTRFARGETAAADSALERLIDGLTDRGEVAWFRALFAMSTRDYQLAADRLSDRRRLGKESLRVRGSADLHLGLVARAEGKIRAADRHFRDAAEAAMELGRHDLFLYRSLELAATRVVTLDSPGAGVRLLDSAWARLGRDLPAAGDRPNRRLASLYAEAGHTGRSRALLAEEEDPEAPLRFRQWPVEAPLGYIALAEDRPAEAVAHFRRALDEGYEPIFFLAPLGRAYEATRRVDSAVAVYERFVATPWLGDYRFRPDSRYLPDVLQSLSSLYAARGDTASAVACLRSFAALWAKADDSLQPRVGLARDRLVTLAGTAELGRDTGRRSHKSHSRGDSACGEMFRGESKDP